MPVASAAVHVLLRCAHRMSDKQFVYADRAVFFDLKIEKRFSSRAGNTVQIFASFQSCSENSLG